MLLKELKVGNFSKSFVKELAKEVREVGSAVTLMRKVSKVKRF